MTTLKDFAWQASAFPAAVEQAQKAAGRKAGQGMLTAVQRGTRSAAPSGRLSGVGRGGAAVGAKLVQTRDGALISAVGPYQLIERDTARHPIRPRHRALHIPGIGYRPSVHHPGTRGKHPFGKAVEAYTPQVPQVYQREVRAAMAKTFR